MANKLEMPCLGHYITKVTFGIGDKPLCDSCGGSDGHGLACKICNLQAHEECIDSNLLVTLNTISKRFTLKEDFYHCSTCNYIIDEYCKRNQQEFVFNLKNHEHPFMLLPREITFTCNACGLLGDRNPFVDIKCNLMIHRDCIDLSRVININCHDHRISLTNHLGRGNWELCGVFRRKIDWNFGGYTCKSCRGYAVHSKCATNFKLWDMKELENVPEVEEIILDPYKMVNGEQEIVHFSHEQHSLTLDEDNVTDFGKMCCDACCLPISDGPFYKCTQCDFLLHKVCANLPRRRRHVLHTHKLDLQVNDESLFQCFVCYKYSEGFRYTYKQFGLFGGASKFITTTLDVQCGSISEPFHHELHKHPLYFTLEESKTCVACGVHSPNVLSCIVCDFALDIKCATLPTKVKHKCDDHFLSLCHGTENVTGDDLWCDICETKADPKVWFYTCEDCGVTLHIKCVLGDLYYLRRKRYKKTAFEDISRTGTITRSEVYKARGHFEDISESRIYECISRSRLFNFEGEVISNEGMTRPLCCVCKLRCIFPAVVINRVQQDASFLSRTYFCAALAPSLVLRLLSQPLTENGTCV